jgi:hypothetical protein
VQSISGIASLQYHVRVPSPYGHKTFEPIRTVNPINTVFLLDEPIRTVNPINTVLIG